MDDEIKLSFRIGRPYSGALRKQAAANHVSVSQYARMVLIGTLENQDVLDIKDEVLEVHQELRRFRAAFDAALQ